MPHEFIFVYPLLHWSNTDGKILSKLGVCKKYKKGDSHIGGGLWGCGVVGLWGCGVVFRRVFKPSTHYDNERVKGGNLEP